MKNLLVFMFLFISPLISHATGEAVLDVALVRGPVANQNIDFGQVQVNTLIYRDLRLTNNSNSDVTNLQLGIGGAGFSGRTNCPDTLAVGANCIVRLEFQPDHVGAFAGLFRIQADGGIHQDFDLSGQGI